MALKKLSAFITALSLMLLMGCGAADPAPAPTVEPNPGSAEIIIEPSDTPEVSGGDTEPDTVHALLAGMTLEQKVGQLFIIRPESLDTDLTPEQVHDASQYGVSALSGDMAAQLALRPAGGFVLFGKNIQDPDQLDAFISALRDESDFAPFIATDEEGGAVSRVAGSAAFDVPRYDGAQAEAAAGEDAVRNMYASIGEYLREYGFNLDFAPVADTNSNPDNVIIGSRAFGSDPKQVAVMVGAAAVDGLHSAGIMTCVKHFPGHGDTTGDSHNGYVSLGKSWAEMLDCELIPFESVLDRTDMLMAAHITLPQVTDDGLPASLSYELLTQRLRGELGYDGVIITDSLAMGAITKNYSPAESAVLAVKAGADIILMPYDYAASFDGVLNAVRAGEISEERIDESVLRILQLKAEYGLLG